MPFGKNRSQWNSNIKKNLIEFHKAITEKNIVFTNKDFTELKVEKLTSIESVMPSSHLILCHPLLLLPPTPHSIRVFSNESLFA